MKQIYSFDTTEQKQALDLVANTNVSFFLTGKAGTGKTTFVRYIIENVKKNFLVVAPTGVAAIQAGGQTIHKTFGFPLDVIGPTTKLNLNPLKVKTLRNVDTIIIDECSMLRADLVDGIDRYLRKAFSTNMQFGGKQIIFVGDLFQLPPVVKKKTAEAEMLEDLYGVGMPFFFKANVIKRMNLPKIQFTQVYRQKDESFVKALNDIRAGKPTDEDLDLLNSRVSSVEGDYAVTLTATNSMADRINQKKLMEIDEKTFTYKGNIDGEFDQRGVIVPDELSLKVGAQVIFCRNDRNGKYINGTIAKVTGLKEKEILVTLENGLELKVEKAVWENKKSVYDRESKKMVTEVIGQYTQYPLKLAWAITIHKSQGMTFDKMRLDLTRGVFEDGQTYVALSRVRSLEGLSVSCKVMPHHVRQNPEITAFAASFNDERLINCELEAGKAIYPKVASHNYDEAVLDCLELIKSRILANDLRNAAILGKRMYDIMLSDDVLMTKTTDMPLLKETNMIGDFLNAILCLYGQRFEEAIVFADKVLCRRTCHEAMFIKSRALTMLGNYEEADKVNVLYNNDEHHNHDGIVDKKWLLLIARTNIKIGDPVVEPVLSLLKICPKCHEALLLVREEYFRDGKTLDSDSEESGLVKLFNDKEVCDNDMLAAIKKCTEENPIELRMLIWSISCSNMV